MSPQQKESITRWLPLSAVVVALISGWVALTSRVSALEAHQDERKDDIANIRDDVKEVRRQVAEMYSFILGK